jgi:cysteinyl-tRNA synthetase
MAAARISSFLITSARLRKARMRPASSLLCVFGCTSRWSSTSADAFRLYLFSHHYRTPWEYVDEEIDDYAGLARDMREAIETPSYGIGEILDSSGYRGRFITALENDLDTPTAIAQLRRLTDEILTADETDTSTAQRDLSTLSGLLGLTLSD